MGSGYQEISRGDQLLAGCCPNLFFSILLPKYFLYQSIVFFNPSLIWLIWSVLFVWFIWFVWLKYTTQWFSLAPPQNLFLP
jgi:hypothetical protein